LKGIKKFQSSVLIIKLKVGYLTRLAFETKKIRPEQRRQRQRFRPGTKRHIWSYQTIT